MVKSPEERDEYEMAIRLAELGWERDNAAFRQTFATQLLPEGSAEQHRSLTEMMRLCTSARTAGRVLRAVGTLDVTPLAQQIRCPTLVLHARGDARVPFDEGRRLAALIPGSRSFRSKAATMCCWKTSRPGRPSRTSCGSFCPAAPGAGRAANAFPQLSKRERQVLALIADGLDNAQLAARLFLSEKTVRNHITSIFAKLDVPNRAQAIVSARRAGLGSGDDTAR